MEAFMIFKNNFKKNFTFTLLIAQLFFVCSSIQALRIEQDEEKDPALYEPIENRYVRPRSKSVGLTKKERAAQIRNEQLRKQQEGAMRAERMKGMAF
jgi:hypothetical protein